jgi:IS30 family transposase
VSHEWIYRHVAADRVRGGKLYKALRQGHKRYRRGANSVSARESAPFFQPLTAAH